MNRQCFFQVTHWTRINHLYLMSWRFYTFTVNTFTRDLARYPRFPKCFQIAEDIFLFQFLKVTFWWTGSYLFINIVLNWWFSFLKIQINWSSVKYSKMQLLYNMIKNKTKYQKYTNVYPKVKKKNMQSF